MSVVQLWLLVGIPVLVVGLALFVPSSPISKLLGYVVLGAGFAAMAIVDRSSGAVFGAILALLYASGQGLPRRPKERDHTPIAPAS